MPQTMGAAYNPQTGMLSFSVFSKNASRLEIYFYVSSMGSDEILKKALNRNQDVWETAISIDDLKSHGLASDFVYYGYRAWGPNWPYSDDWQKGSKNGFISDVDSSGNRFNPNKLLIDPYARELSHDPQPRKIYMDPNAYIDDYYGGRFREYDTGEIAPKSILLLGDSPIGIGVKPKRHIKDDVIYEVNLRGFTKADQSIPESRRGTYKGAAAKAKYLKELGVTAVEFLPIHEFADEQNDDGDPRGDNYWGYMTLNYFSPNRRYSSDKTPGGPTREFKEMVKAFHDEGIKVFLDVVYNHTGEGIVRRLINQGNPVTEEEIINARKDAKKSRNDINLQDLDAACILSFTGLDNSSYYYLCNGNRSYEGQGGCGGNLNYDNPAVRKLIIDSLKYWADDMGVDGFRFDLAPILTVTGTNGNYWANINSKIFEDISNALPSRTINPNTGVDTIAEPWGDKSGIEWSDKFPHDWSIWNKAFRDTIKTSMNKYGVASLEISKISQVCSGSKEFIWKKPWNAINYIESHDDCDSMRNIFSYNKYFHLDEAELKYDRISWDQGNDIEKQRKAVRTAFTLLMLSVGVPMFAGGDELLRAIPPYAEGIGKMNMVSVDSPEVYLDFANYNKLMAAGPSDRHSIITGNDDLYSWAFVKNLIGFRNRHECLRPYDYFSGATDTQNGLKDIAWYKEDGWEIKDQDWDKSDFISYRINAGAEKVQDTADRVESIYVAYNRSPDFKAVKLPENVSGKQWYRLIDTDNTNGWMTWCCNFDGGTTKVVNEYNLHERSVLVLIEK